jgi:dihydrofolate reductase
MTKVILYIATSQDGFIADKNGGVDWLPHPSDDNSDDEFGYQALIDSISVIVMGSKSYKQILGFGDWAWQNKQTYVFTSQPLTTVQNNIAFVHDDVKTFMENLKELNPNQNIWLLGGAELIKSFSKEHLIDEYIITVTSDILNEGIKLKLYDNNVALVQTKSCSNGMQQQFYVKKEV